MRHLSQRLFDCFFVTLFVFFAIGARFDLLGVGLIGVIFGLLGADLIGVRFGSLGVELAGARFGLFGVELIIISLGGVLNSSYGSMIANIVIYGYKNRNLSVC